MSTVVVRMDKIKSTQQRISERVEREIEQAAEEIERLAEARKPSSVAIQLENKGNGNVEIQVGSRQYFYGPFVEFGTVFQPARPFLQPAVEAVWPQLKRDLSNLERIL